MRTITTKQGTRVADLIGASLSLIAVMPLLASCASSGLYDMSDEWCARHLDASAAHCAQDQNARALSGHPGSTFTSDTRASRAGEDIPQNAAEAGE